MTELSPQTQKLIQKYQNWYNSLQPKEGITTIHVDEVASRVAAFYEKNKVSCRLARRTFNEKSRH